MNLALDAFLTGFINGITFTLWGIIAVIFGLFLYFLLTREDDDDDDDSGTLQPVYQGADK